MLSDMTTSTLAPPAPLWRRLAASVYDGLLVLAICMAITVLTTPVLAFLGGNNDRAVLQVLMVLGTWFYFARSWTRGGQTLGMRAWRLRLRRGGTDASLGLTVASARFFLVLLLCILPITVGGLAAMRDSANAAAWLLLWLLPGFSMLLAVIGSRRALHDLACGSEMVSEPTPEQQPECSAAR